jgi:hypothetical protein
MNRIVASGLFGLAFLAFFFLVLMPIFEPQCKDVSLASRLSCYITMGEYH